VTTVTIGFFDQATGTLTLDMEQPVAREARQDIAGLLAPGTEMGCANPVTKYEFSPSPSGQLQARDYWHNSFWEGPGRRSVIRVQGCPIQCDGCWVKETWDTTEGVSIHIDQAADALLDPAYERDGVTILGGEPFAQPAAVASLIGELRGRQPDLHITIYSGFTLQSLIRRNDPDVNLILSEVNVLIDGPYVKSKASTAGPWTGSGNQTVHYLR